MNVHPTGSQTIINSFPGYEYVARGEDGHRHNMYRGVDVGFGGYIYSNVGMYYNVAMLDIQSMHPNSIIAMNYFGEFTKNYKDILDARIFIKHGDYDSARQLMGGKLAPYLNDKSQADDLAQALKISLNSTYGITAASFDNALRDRRNVNNIVALRGALFMKTLQDEVEARGYQVVSIRTDSIKIANADDDIIQYCCNFARDYGYTFEHETTYEKLCLVDKSNYVAKYDRYGIRNKGGKHAGEWTATGAKFQHPYIFKTLFSHEQIVFEDYCETKEVKDSTIYLDMNEDLEDPIGYESELSKLEKKYPFDHPALIELRAKIEECHNYRFVGRIGSFCPIKPGCNGGLLVKSKDNQKYDSVSGAKGYRWLEAETVTDCSMSDAIDVTYFRKLVDEALDEIAIYGDPEAFIADDSQNVFPYCKPEDCKNCSDKTSCDLPF